MEPRIEKDPDTAQAARTAARRDEIDRVRARGNCDTRLPVGFRQQSDATLYDECGLYR